MPVATSCVITAEPVKRHSHKEILVFIFLSTLLKLSAETKKNYNKLVLSIFFFTILFISLALFLVSVTKTSHGTSDENGFNGGHGHMT